MDKFITDDLERKKRLTFKLKRKCGKFNVLLIPRDVDVYDGSSQISELCSSTGGIFTSSENLLSRDGVLLCAQVTNMDTDQIKRHLDTDGSSTGLRLETNEPEIILFLSQRTYIYLGDYCYTLRNKTGKIGERIPTTEVFKGLVNV